MFIRHQYNYDLSEQALALIFDSSTHSLILDLLDSAVCDRESVAEVEHDGIKLDNGENETQNVGLGNKWEPER